MRKRLISSFILALITLLALPMAKAQPNSPYANTEVFIVTSLSDKNLYVGVPVCFSVRLYSTNPDIDFVKPVSHPGFDGFDVRKYPMVRTDRYHRITRETYGKKQYYAVWLEDVVLTPTATGTFTLKGEDYIAGLNEYQVFTDPFWGTVRRAVPEEYPIKGESVKVKVSNLPKAPTEFSGAVGEYSIQTRVPRDITAGDDGTLIVTISGQGDLSNVELPNLLSQFPTQLGVKSISQDCSTYLEDGVIRSVMTFECGFIPSEVGSITIPSVSIVYFNPIQKKFQTATSDPIQLEVKSSTRKLRPSEIQQI